MRRFLVGSLLSGMVHLMAQGVTPLETEIPEGKPFEVTCEYSLKENFRPAGISEKPTPGEYHYSVILPPGYAAESSAQFPALFVMSPEGNGPVKRYAEAAAQRKWILIGFKEAKNGPWEPILGNLLAAHDDAVKRFRIEEGAKYATGLSGGARGSSRLVQMRPGFRGIVLQGAGFSYDDNGGGYIFKGLPKPFCICLVMGVADSNRVEIERMQKAAPKSAKLHVIEFDGKHEWAPTETMNQAFDLVSEPLSE